MDYLGEPIVIPEIIMPEYEFGDIIPAVPTIELPKEVVPSYTPLVVPPSDLRPPPGVKGPMQPEDAAEEASSEPSAPTAPPTRPQIPEVRIFEVPGTDLEVPVPSSEILVTAVSTATVSVAATLTATAIFKRLVSLFKPLIKKILTKKTKNAED